MKEGEGEEGEREREHAGEVRLYYSGGFIFKLWYKRTNGETEARTPSATAPNLPGLGIVCFITAGPITKLCVFYYCRTYYKAEPYVFMCVYCSTYKAVREGGELFSKTKSSVHVLDIPKAKIRHAVRVGFDRVRCVCMSIRVKPPSALSPSPYASLSRAQSLTLARPHTLALLPRTASHRLIPLSDDGRPIQGAKPILVGAGPLDGSNWSRPACLLPSAPRACAAPPFSPTSHFWLAARW